MLPTVTYAFNHDQLHPTAIALAVQRRKRDSARVGLPCSNIGVRSADYSTAFSLSGGVAPRQVTCEALQCLNGSARCVTADISSGAIHVCMHRHKHCTAAARKHALSEVP
jgi:hypothetical protein